MILDRPLKEVPIQALYALHRGIENESGLIGSSYFLDGKKCALSCLSSKWHDFNHLAKVMFSLGLTRDTSPVLSNTEAAIVIHFANDRFSGSPEERREYMLRLIVEELRHRGKSIDGKAAQKELKHAMQ